MMMKNTFILILIVASTPLFAQDIEAKLDEAKTAYGSGNMEEARFALEQSLVELDKLIGQEVLKILPKEMGGLQANAEDDNVSGSTGYTGVFVERDYPGEPKYISVQVMADSPFLAMVNMALTNPMIASMSDGNQEVTKISGYKSLVELEEGEEGEEDTYKFMTPVSSSLITVEVTGFGKSDAYAMVSELDYRSIVSLISSGQ